MRQRMQKTLTESFPLVLPNESKAHALPDMSLPENKFTLPENKFNF